ncbi:hypothetical protein J11TS1_07480 [Oceanobacillus sp. J11TS1]|nr:hypothetical protein J11TS1_07480 [Oceanobacillus sp. J11TS1]
MITRELSIFLNYIRGGIDCIVFIFRIFIKLSGEIVFYLNDGHEVLAIENELRKIPVPKLKVL